MNWMDLKMLDEQYMMQTCHRFPVDIDRGQGATLYDLEGREYIDFTSGMGANSLGHGHAQWAESIMEQTLKLGHASNLVYTQPSVLLAEQLCRRTGMANTCFTSSGSEANALMIRLAQQYSFDRYGKDRNTILTLKHPFKEQSNAIHNELSQTQHPHYFNSYIDGIRFISADMEDVQANASNDVCAVMLELIQKDGSMEPLSRQFVHALAVFCAEQDWLLLIDEVQTGAGRTGTLFAFQQYGILPDVISFGGGISGGLPLGGILANNRCKEVLGPNSYHSTFGGNPVCCAAALAVLDVLNENTLAQVKEKGDYLRSGIESLALSALGETYGSGLMIGVTLLGSNDHTATACLLSDYGLLCIAVRDGLLFLPPLLVTKEEMDRGLAILKEALGEGV